VVLGVLATALMIAAGCGALSEDSAAPPQAIDVAGVTVTRPSAPSTSTTERPTRPQRVVATPTTTAVDPEFLPPDWLGTRVLSDSQIRNSANIETPAELVDRRFATIDLLGPGPDGFASSIATPLPEAVAARSTWRPGCPVGLDDLAYLTVSHWGFDGQTHTGEVIVHASVAEDMVGVFSKLYDARYPIEALRVVSNQTMAGPPTGDLNISSAFTCRSTVSSSRWSEHAYGLAIDLNPFHNPYIKGSRLIPELSAAYLDRGNVRDGMILANDAVVQAFADIGWSWGGEWTSALDYMHFSHNDR
jgi:hypothetical protein